MPIYLYLKQHKVTKLKYFGKTTKKNPEKYRGSGDHWKRHLKVHGNIVDTLCVWEFEDITECNEFAIKFSEENDIVNSNKWANIIVENGLDGAPPGENHHMFNRRGEDHPSFGKKRPDATERMKGEKNPSFGLMGKNHPTFGKRSKPSDEIRKLWSDQRSGINNPNYGKHWSEEWKKAQSERFSGSKSPMYGKKQPHLIEYNQARKVPIPQDFLIKAQELCSFKLSKYYNVSYPVIYRWKKESGLSVPKSYQS